jgi:copper chaperone
MITFEVKDMTCGHCASTITKALRQVDAQAKVSIDLATHRVAVEPTEADEAMLREAIAEAGYSPVALASAPASADTAADGRTCCGQCH